MKPKLTYLLSLTFLFLFSGSSVVFADDWQDLRLAAEQGDDLAQYNMGVMYAKGEGVPQDYKEAAKWYRLSAEQGFAQAQSNLGSMYAAGEGVPQDYKEAVRWTQLAAEQGHPYAQHNLGVRYALGQGVPQDSVLAHMWFNLSGSNGYKGAVEGRNLVETAMTPSQIEEAQRLARNWRPKR